MRVAVGLGIACGFALIVWLLRWEREIPTQNPRGVASVVVRGREIEVEYGRPALRGRAVLERARVGTLWRLGADRATTFTTETPVEFGDTSIEEGAYSLFARRVDGGRWHLVFNREVGQWGLEHDDALDVAEIPLEHTFATTTAERFTIEVVARGGGGTLRFHWGRDLLQADFLIR